MKVKFKNMQLRMGLIGLCTVAMVFGLTTGSVMAQEEKAAVEKLTPEEQKECNECEKKTAEKKLPPHQRPAPSKAPANAKAPNLAAAATNPIAAMVQFQLQNTYSPENYNSSGYSNVTTVQAVAPIPLPWKSVPMLITRSTLPWVTTPELGDVHRHRGFGDFQMLMLAIPKLKTKGVQLGLGINTSWPTAGDNVFTGSGKYEAGPSALYINMQTPHLQWGLFVHQLWDYANSNNNQDRSSVSKLSIQPILTYHFGKGWYVQSPESPQTYDFEANEWSWNLGPVIGKVTKIGKLPVKLFAAAYYNPVDPDDAPASKYTVKFNITFLFPE